MSSAPPSVPPVDSEDDEEDVRDYLRRLITGRKFSGYGCIAQVQFARLLQADGFEVAVEVAVPDPVLSGRKGRIDLVATLGDLILGVEIDCWRTPKSKSIYKLAEFEQLTARAVFLNHDRHMFGKPVYLPAEVRHLAGMIDVRAHLDVEFGPDCEKKERLAEAYAALRTYPRTITALSAAT